MTLPADKECEMTERVSDRIADDSCAFCGLHFNPAGGHYYEGYRNEYGNIECEGGGLVVPHMANCEFQICPKCLAKIRGAGVEC